MRRMVLIVGVITTLLGSLLAAAPASATVLVVPTAPPKDKIVIDLVTVNGSGCPAGSAAVAIAPDNTAFTVTYSRYMAQVGVGAVPTDMRKNCQLAIVVHVPSGFTYAVAQVDYRGFASIAKGATALERANYYFQGLSQTAFREHSFSSMLDDWQTTDKTDVAALIYHPCGALRNFNINTELRAAAGTSDVKKTTSFISMDSTDGVFNTIYHLAWGRC